MISSRGSQVSEVINTASYTEPRSSFKTDVVAALTIYLFLLMAIPASLGFAFLGTIGGPASVLAVLFMGLYLITRLHPAFDTGAGRQPIRTAAALFLFSTLASFIAANLHPLSGMAQDGVERGIFEIVGLVGVLLIAADGISSIDRLVALLGRIVIGATAMAGLAIIEFFSGIDFTKYVEIPGLSSSQVVTDLIVRDGLYRPAATTAHPLELAAVLAMALPLAIHRARFATGNSWQVRWIQVVVIGAGLIVTLSRTAILGLLVIAAVLLPTWPKTQRRYAYAALVSSILLVYVALPKILTVLISILAQIVTGSSSTQSRTNALSAALPLVLQHPWLGTGFGDFFPQVYFFTDDQYLNSVISNGLTGLLALVVLFISGWLVARCSRRRSKDLATRDLAQALAAAVAVSAGCFATFDVLAFKTASGLTFLLLGCTAALWRLIVGSG
jgi:O-antigen ligase